MPISIPKKSVLNWYEYDMEVTLQLICGFVKTIESQADESYPKYQSEVDTVGDDTCPYTSVEIYNGLDSASWDLDSIFKDYFPSLQRRSALLSIFSLFENELNKLCYLYMAEKSITIDLSDLKGSGVVRAVEYLSKVVEINTHKSSREWQEIKSIQKLRNVIAHQDGKLYDRQGGKLKDTKLYISKTSTLYGDNEVGIHSGFLIHFLDTLSAYCIKLSESIAQTETACA